MNRLCLFFVLGFILCHWSNASYAQMLEDDDADNLPVLSDEVDESEELFNQIFDDHELKEDSIDSNNSLDKNSDIIAKKIKDSGVSLDSKSRFIQAASLEGDMSIGVSKGSFQISQDLTGKTQCSFSVTLKSNLDRDIKVMALRLVYSKNAFAFIFKNVKAGESQVKYIYTYGDLCYNISGAPNIDINICKINGVPSTECAQRLKWDAKIEAPNLKK